MDRWVASPLLCTPTISNKPSLGRKIFSCPKLFESSCEVIWICEFWTLQITSWFWLAYEGGVRFSLFSPFFHSFVEGQLESSLTQGYSLNIDWRRTSFSFLWILPNPFLDWLWFLSWSLSSFQYSSLFGGYSDSRYLRYSSLSSKVSPSSVALGRFVVFLAVLSSTGKDTT